MKFLVVDDSVTMRWIIRRFMVVTTRGAREDIIAAVEAGVNNYILRPFTPSVLKEKIDRLLTSAGVAA